MGNSEGRQGKKGNKQEQRKSEWKKDRDDELGQNNLDKEKHKMGRRHRTIFNNNKEKRKTRLKEENNQETEGIP